MSEDRQPLPSGGPHVTWRVLLFGFRGRIDRTTFWLRGMLPLTAISGVLEFPLILFDEPNGTRLSMSLQILMAAFLIFVPIAIWAEFALLIKRLHDRGRSGWFLVLCPAGGGIGALVAILAIALGPPEPIIDVLTLLAILAGLPLTYWPVIEILFLRGTPGPNRYGERPIRFN